MALGDVTPGFSAASVLAILKESYNEKDVQNLLERNSPTLAKIQKVPGYGKYYVIPMLYSRGGGVAGDFTLLTATSAAANTAAKVPYGQCFSRFDISPKEHLASDNGGGNGAFIQFLREYFYASQEALRKTIANAIFGMGYCEVAPVTVDAGRLIFTMKSNGALAIDIGSKILFSTGPTPGGTLRNATPSVVTKIADNGNDTVTVTVAAQYDAACATGDWCEIYGFRDGSGKPLMFVGLRGWLPIIGSRTGATWTSYIGTDFFGLTRSTHVTRMAGQFYLRNNGAAEKYADAIVKGVRYARRGGGVPDMIVLNDVDFGTIIGEIKAAQTYFQQINGPAAGSEMKAVNGLTSMMFAFSSTWIQYVVDDPYCPVGVAYILETESIGMAMLSNPKPIETNIPSTNEGGAPKIAAQDAPPMQYQWNIDDLVATAPSDTTDGQGARVTTQFFGAFFVRNPAHCCVVQLDVTLVA
jgi:hypothetical protein